MCTTGSTKSYRVKINIIGYTKAGKSTLILRLLGKPFEILESTEGIHTQLIHTTFSKTHEVLGSWEEIHLDTEMIVKDFNKQALALKENLDESSDPGKDVDTASVSPQQTMPQPVNASPTGFQKLLRRLKSPFTRKRSTRQEMVKSQPAVVRQVVVTAQESSHNDPSPTPSTNKTSGMMMDKVTLRQLNNLKDRKTRMKEEEDTTECLINLWDHGGQVEFLATHHLFLDADAVNLIVMDITKKLHEEIPSKHQKAKTDGVPRTGAQFLDYWMQMIQEKSDFKDFDPTVAIILTHLDQVTTSEAEEYVSGLIKYIKGKPYSKYIDIENIFEVDNKNGVVSEFNQLRKEIFQMATQHSTWGIERPTRWLKLEASIHEEAKAKSSTHIHRTKIQELASGFGISKEEVRYFLQFHHAMGDFVHYQDEALKDLIITDPQWLVDMFKDLITADEFLNERGINPLMLDEYKRTALLSKSTLHSLWKGQDVKFLTELMKKFQLIVPLTNSTREYLVPCMLPPKQLDIYETRLFKDMTMVYSSPLTARSSKQSDSFLPVGSYHRLLALLSSLTPWRLCVTDHLTYSDASFEVEYGVRVALTLLKHIRVTVWCGSPAFMNTAVRLLPYIREAINENSVKLGLPVHEKFLIMCPQRQLPAAPGESISCLVPVVLSKLSVDPQAKTCPMHNIPVFAGDYSWLLKVNPLPDAYTVEKFPTLRSLIRERGLGVYDPISVEQCSETFPISMTKKWRQLVATVSQGKSQTLKPPDSGVSLTIPEGIHAVLKGCVHTDHSRFVKAIPADECIISPMVEFHRHSLNDEDEERKLSYTIRIPHCIRQRSKWRHIKVRKGDIYKDEDFVEIKERSQAGKTDTSYEIDEHFIIIHTTHFTDFTCTMCNGTFCSDLAMVFLFGSLCPLEDITVVKVQPFLCSFLYVIEDYQKVNIIILYMFSFFIFLNT